MGTEVQNEVTVETIEEHDNEAVMVAPCLSESITEEEAFVLCQVLIKLTGQPVVNWQNLCLSFLHAYTKKTQL